MANCEKHVFSFHIYAFINFFKERNLRVRCGVCTCLCNILIFHFKCKMTEANLVFNPQSPKGGAEYGSSRSSIHKDLNMCAQPKHSFMELVYSEVKLIEFKRDCYQVVVYRTKATESLPACLSHAYLLLHTAFSNIEPLYS